jgi:hypothetical protein
MSAEPGSLARAREIEVWIARVRLLAVLFAGLEVGLLTDSAPAYGSVFTLELPLD